MSYRTHYNVSGVRWGVTSNSPSLDCCSPLTQDAGPCCYITVPPHFHICSQSHQWHFSSRSFSIAHFCFSSKWSFIVAIWWECRTQCGFPKFPSMKDFPSKPASEYLYQLFDFPVNKVPPGFPVRTSPPSPTQSLPTFKNVNTPRQENVKCPTTQQMWCVRCGIPTGKSKFRFREEFGRAGGENLHPVIQSTIGKLSKTCWWQPSDGSFSFFSRIVSLTQFVVSEND